MARRLPAGFHPVRKTIVIDRLEIDKITPLPHAIPSRGIAVDSVNSKCRTSRRPRSSHRVCTVSVQLLDCRPRLSTS